MCYINNFLFGECKTQILKILTFKESTSGNTPKPQFPTNSMMKEFASNETVLRTIIKERAKKENLNVSSCILNNVETNYGPHTHRP